MKKATIGGIVTALAFVCTILAANVVTTAYGTVPVGFGLTATAGTYFVGLAFVLRDSVQDLLGRLAVVLAILVGAILSFLVSAPFSPWYFDGPVSWWRIATASAVAFLLSEAADFAIYTPLRKRGYIRAAVASNIVGAVLDTALFLTIAGFPLAENFAGQVLGKIAITLLAVFLVIGVRTLRVQPAEA